MADLLDQIHAQSQPAADSGDLLDQVHAQQTGQLEPIGYRNGMPVYSIDVYGRAGGPPQPPAYQGTDEQGKPIIASPPGPPAAPVPWGLMSPERQRAEAPVRLNPRTGLPMRDIPMGTVPILDAPYTGGVQAVHGLEAFAGAKTGEERAGATSQMIRGGLEASLPLLPGAAVGAPLATALTLGAGMGLSQGSEYLLNKAGVPPGYSALASDFIGLFGAGAAYKKMQSLAKLPYVRESNALQSRLEEAVGQAKDPNATPMERAAAKAKIDGLLKGIEQAEAGAPGGYLLPQVSLRDVVNPMMPGPIVKSNLTPEEHASQAYLTSRGIETPLSMQTGSKVAAGLEGTVQNVPGGAGFAEKMQAAKEQLRRAGQQELARISPEPATAEEAGAAIKEKLSADLEKQRATLAQQVSPQPATRESAGAKVIEQGKQAIRAKDQAADAAYKQAWESERDPRNFEDIPTGEIDENGDPVTQRMALPIDMLPIAKELKPLADRYERTLSDTDVRASLGLKTMRAIIAEARDPATRYKPASAAETDLGTLKAAARTETGLSELRDPSQGLAAKSLVELQNAIDEKLRSSADPSALEDLQAGRKATAEKHDIADVYRKFGPNLEKIEPVGAYGRLTWQGDTGIEHLRNVAKIAPDAMPDVGRAFIDSGGKWESLGPETKKILFRDPEVIKQLDQYYADNAKFGPMAEKNPVALADMLTARRGRFNTELRDVAQRTPDQIPALARSLVEGLLDRSTREGDIQKVQSTLDSFLDLDPESKEILFKNPGLVKDLNNLFMSMKRMAKNPNPSGSGFIMALNQYKGRIFTGLGLLGGGAMAHAVPGSTGGMAAGAGILASVPVEIGANKALANLLFNQKFIRMLTQGLKMDMAGNKEGAALAARTLGKMAEEGPPEEPPPGGAPSGGPPANPPGAPAGSAGGGTAPGGTGGSNVGGRARPPDTSRGIRP